MGGRASSRLIWIAVIATIAFAVNAARSPKTRSSMISVGQQILKVLGQIVDEFQARFQSRLGRRIAALDEISQTLDAATAQYDSSMTVSKVSEALSDDPILRGKKLGVRIIGGILHLEGEVNSQHEKIRAGEIARRASGAELVANDLTVALRS
ncbi:MAG: BON domain-containing protein [Chloroflexota bacterium]|jgi:osmotically-inducible protein OsmY